MDLGEILAYILGIIRPVLMPGERLTFEKDP